MPMPMRGLTMRTIPRASSFWSFFVSVTRTRVLDASGLLVQTKIPPRDRSQVTPSVREPVSRFKTTTSAKRIADTEAAVPDGETPGFVVRCSVTHENDVAHKD